ncbi:MAG: hypothetical protein ACHQAZ_06610 [Gammaproteobacteria bacterium]|jgi:hypothetical protein|nr:hypothetical protein [Gammaproteobacteria bacterium]
MKNHAWSSAIAAFGLASLALLPCAAQADATIQTLTHFDELTGIASHDSTTTDYIQGNKKREENLRKFTGSVLGAWQKFRNEDNGALDVDIYRVGDNKHYDLDPKKKTYNEDAIYDPQQAPKQQNSKEAAQQQQEQDKENDTKVTKNEFTVKATGRTKDINGFDTTEYVVTWDVETENTKTGEKGKSLMTTDTWNSTDARLAKAHAEEAAYAHAYLKLMQIPSNPDDLKLYGFGQGSVSINGEDQKKFFDKLHTIKGYPVSMDVRWESAGSGDKESDKDSSSNDDAQQAHPQTLDSALGSIFGGKSKSDDSDKKVSTGTPGMNTIFHSNIEVKSVDTSAIAASQFEVPGDYKKGD